MGRVAYKCWTYGENKREGHTLWNEDGTWAGHVTFAQYKSVCGKWVDDADDADFDAVRRPAGICKACWAQHKADRARFAQDDVEATTSTSAG